MQILRWPETVSFLAIDVDETVYSQSPEYNQHQRQAETEVLAEFWGLSFKEALRQLEQRTRRLAETLNRTPSAAEVIRSCEGLSQEWLVKVRSERWQPGLFLKPHPGLPEKMAELARSYKVAFASTSPKEVLFRIFDAIGFTGLLSQAMILGGGDVKKSKPAPDVYLKVIEAFGLPKEQGLSVGDRIDFDAYPAVEAGMGAVVISGIDDFEAVVDRLLSAKRKMRAREVYHE